MNLVCAMTAYRRPEHTARAIRSLLGEYVHVFVDRFNDDPTMQGQIIKVIECQDVSPLTYTVASYHVGLWATKNAHFQCIEGLREVVAWEALLMIEDDCVLSPDAISLCRWFLSLPNREEYLFLNLANCNRPSACLGRELDVVESTRIESPWAWCFTREAWESKIRPIWNSKKVNPRGFDWSLTYHMALNQWKSLMPVLPRAKNIGRELGENGGAEIFDSTLAIAAASDGTWGDEYRLVKTEEPLSWWESWMDDERNADGAR